MALPFKNAISWERAEEESCMTTSPIQTLVDPNRPPRPMPDVVLPDLE